MISNLQTDESQLLTIFPAEIWQNILGHTNTWKSYQNISSASLHFSTWMLPRRKRILFAEVLPFVLKHPCKKAVKLRQVCRHWKEGMDNYLVQQPLNFISQFLDLDRKPEQKFHQPEQFTSTESFTRFEQHFDSFHLIYNLNPFLYRSVYIFCMPANHSSLVAFITALLSFLDKYGVHVWFFRFYAYVSTLEEQQAIMEMLPRCLNLMSNVKSINLGVGCPQNRERQNRMLESIPVFPVLRDLQFVSMDTKLLAVFKSFARANPQVKAVDSSPFAQTPEYIKFCLEDWPNLTAVVINLCGWNKSFETFRKARVVCPLTKLQLNAEDLIDVSWESIFVALEEKFAETLEQLYIRLSNLKGDLPELKLRKLKLLNLHLQKIVSLDFLLPILHTLEQFTLTVKQRICTQDFDHGRLDLYKYVKFPEKSNIWQVFPKLKLLRICNGYRIRDKTWKMTTRDQWKETERERLSVSN